jgi:hypothetical protein
MRLIKKYYRFFAALFLVLALFLLMCETVGKEPEIPDKKEETTLSLETGGEKPNGTTQPLETTMPPDETDAGEIEWTAALQKYKSEESLIPLIDFLNLYPNSKYFTEASELIEDIREDSAYSEKFLSEPTLELIDEFLSKFPGHKDTGTAQKLRGEFTGEIHAMLQKGFIAAVSVGESIMRNVLQVQNKTDSGLEITMSFGTYFAANSGNVQNMLAREQKSFFIEPGQIEVLYVDVACMNIYKDIPGEKNYFTVEALADNSRLIKLLKILEENPVSYEITQAAVWIIADNPGKEAVLGAIVYENGEQAIKDSDYKEALRLIELADRWDMSKVHNE